MHIAVLADRASASHPYVRAWQGRGHQVTVLARRRRRSLPDDADVVLEVVGDSTFLTPLWLRAPQVTLVEDGRPRRGRATKLLLREAPLRLLYRGSRFVAASQAAAEELARLGVAPDRVSLVTGLDPEAAASRVLEALEAARREGRPEGSPLRSLAASDSARAAGLAGSAMAANAIALLFTIVFARILGSDGYGSLIALLAAFLVLAIPGQALQVAVAREVSREVDGHDPALAANVRGWTRALALATPAVAIASVLGRDPIADVIGVDLSWAAAATVPMGCCWLLLCIQRGVLQGIGSYMWVGASIVGEAFGRLVFALAFVAAGLDATGAFLGTAASIVATSLVLALPLHRRLVSLGAGERSADRPLRELVTVAAAPLAALALFALLQNLDVIVVRNMATEHVASQYAAVSVAAKALIWVAIGLGLFLLPEATRRTTAGEDGRPVLVRTLALVTFVGLVAWALYAVAGEQILELAFGAELGGGSAALPWLALAMTLLAAVYLSVQFLLALDRSHFLGLLAVAAVAEAGLLVAIGPDLTNVALGVLGLEACLATVLTGLAMRRPAA